MVADQKKHKLQELQKGLEEAEALVSILPRCAISRFALPYKRASMVVGRNNSGKKHTLLFFYGDPNLRSVTLAVAIQFQIRKMDLEARSLPAAQKAMLMVKLREYKSDCSNLKRDVKKTATPDTSAERDELMETGLGADLSVRPTGKES